LKQILIISAGKKSLKNQGLVSKTNTNNLQISSKKVRPLIKVYANWQERL
jgi:hypothetical protein